MTDRTASEDTRERFLLFETSHNAMWAEEVARERGVPAEVGPAPPEAEDACGLALRVPASRLEELRKALEAEGIPNTPVR